MAGIKFLIDENVLGLYRYLDGYEIKYKKVGDADCPKLGSDDSIVAKFALDENLVVLTNDDKLQKQCKALGVVCIVSELSDFAEKVKKYVESN